MPEYQRHEHDVLVIGAGGAGLRAAIESAHAGASVGLICKSLLGKAHTVMAEGGVAAALANVDDRDNWKVHFADTMRGASISITGGWRSCTPQRRPIVCGSSKHGAPFSTGRRTAEFFNAISADTNTRVWRTLATALALR